MVATSQSTVQGIVGRYHRSPEQGLQVHVGLFVHGSLYDSGVICLRPYDPDDIVHVSTNVFRCPLGPKQLRLLSSTKLQHSIGSNLLQAQSGGEGETTLLKSGKTNPNSANPSCV